MSDQQAVISEINRLVNAGIHHFKQKDFEQAEQAFLKAIAYHPHDINLIANLARIYYEQGNLDQAYHLYRFINLAQPDDVDAWVGLGLISQQKNLGILPEIIQTIHRLEPNHPSLPGLIKWHKENQSHTTRDQKIQNRWNPSGNIKLPQRIRFWQSPLIMRYLDTLICEQQVENRAQAIAKLANDRVFELGVSVGCGDARQELSLIRNGMVKKFILFELAEEKIKRGQQLAQKWGLQDQVEFKNGDFLKEIPPASVDFVHWNDALHHMFKVDQTLKWSRDVLKDNGAFYMCEYAGPARFQWHDSCLQFANQIRAMLPKAHLLHPYYPKEMQIYQDRNIQRPAPQEIICEDPSEAVHSDQILPAVEKYFPQAKIIPLGGVIYYIVLNDIIHNIAEEEEHDRAFLNLLLALDTQYTQNNPNNTIYAAAYAKK